jgi:hypothetical protein
MVFSLFTSGILLSYSIRFLGVVRRNVYHVVADMFRPAMFVSLATYSKPENRTRSLTLVRLAVNLGFAAGFRRFDHHEYGLRRIILGRWKFLYHIDSDFTVLVKERKKSADLKLQKAKPKYRSPF